MSSALAPASVTAVLRELLRDALLDNPVSAGLSTTVTARAPDLLNLTATGDVGLNVYLYGTSPNPGWRNAGLPSRTGDGSRRSNPPLALDLHYLVTAYATDDLHADVLLGVAMQRLHEVPVLARDTIRTALQNASVLSGDLAASGLADQVELIKITPEAMGAEELSKLWAAIGASYRLTAGYLATVVLIEAEDPVRTALPVLTRGDRHPVTDEEMGALVVPGLVPPYPTLTGVVPPESQPAVPLDGVLTLRGHHLDGVGHSVEIAHTRFEVVHALGPDTVAAGEVTVTIPAGAPADWPAGLYTVRVAVTRDGKALTTNSLPLALAPTMDVPNIGVVLNAGTATITVPVEPHVWDGQTASLVVGEREVAAEGFTGPASSLTFELEDAPLGTHLARLRVDGVESAYIVRTAAPPEFDSTQEVTIA